MKNLKRQNPGQLFVAQELINKVIKLNYSVAELRIDGILIILGRKMRLIWLCFIVTSLITEAGVDIMDIMYLLERCKDILEYFKVA